MVALKLNSSSERGESPVLEDQTAAFQVPMSQRSLGAELSHNLVEQLKKQKVNKLIIRR